jgi:hypothetical protein
VHGALVMVIALVWVSGTVFAAFALFDAFRHTTAEWDAVGQSRPVWVGLLVVGLGGGLFGILPIIYWLTVSPKLKAAVTA